MLRSFSPLKWLSRWRSLVVFAGWATLAAGASAGTHFSESADEWGLEFRHHHGGSGSFFMVETMGAGVVLFDFDNDGDEDVLFIDSGDLPGYEGPPARSVLYRNEGQGRFIDWTDQARIPVALYGMGGNAVDVDLDGDLDLYLTAFGKNRLLLNNGGGSFVDATEKSGVGDPSWSTASAFSDVDLDGDLDLYVVNYVDFSIDNNRVCGDIERGLRSYCHPDVYDGLPDRFYRNRGDGTFEDQTESAGFGGRAGKGLGATFFDENRDGWPDLYVANDMTANFLFRNSEGAFREDGLSSGVAYSDRGEAEAGMGVAIGDLDGDGGDEIFITHLDRQSNALYSRAGEHFFSDRRRAAGLVQPSFAMSGFGAAFGDLDLDADLDCVVANGHIIHNIDDMGSGTTFKQRNQIFENDGQGKLAEVPDSGLDAVESSRGLAIGDLDGDGDLDLVISNSNAKAEVYQNEADGSAWLAVVPRGAGSSTAEVGARVQVKDSLGGWVQYREIQAGSSYLSQHASVAHFGMAGAQTAELSVEWPSRRRQRFESVPTRRRYVVVEPVDRVGPR